MVTFKDVIEERVDIEKIIRDFKKQCPYISWDIAQSQNGNSAIIFSVPDNQSSEAKHIIELYQTSFELGIEEYSNARKKLIEFQKSFKNKISNFISTVESYINFIETYDQQRILKGNPMRIIELIVHCTSLYKSLIPFPDNLQILCIGELILNAEPSKHPNYYHIPDEYCTYLKVTQEKYGKRKIIDANLNELLNKIYHSLVIGLDLYKKGNVVNAFHYWSSNVKDIDLIEAIYFMKLKHTEIIDDFKNSSKSKL